MQMKPISIAQIFQSYLLTIFQYQPIDMQYLGLNVEQPIKLWLSVVLASLGISNTLDDNSNINTPINTPNYN